MSKAHRVGRLLSVDLNSITSTFAMRMGYGVPGRMGTL